MSKLLNDNELKKAIVSSIGVFIYPETIDELINLINQQVIQALESLRIVRQGKTYSDATDWKHEVELQEEELSRLIKEYKGE